MKDCGGFVYFQKLKSMVGNSGLCELYDSRTSEDYGKNCHDFSSLKYNRTKERKIIKEHLMIGE